MHRAAIIRISSIRRVWLLLLLAGLGGCQRQGHLVEKHLLEFGTIIEITLICDDLTRAQRLLGEIEARLKLYRNQWHAWEASDLTRFNAELQRGKRSEIPASLLQLLHLSKYYHGVTGGLFNPAMGKLIAAQGFHGGDANEAAIAEFRRDIPDMDDLQIDAQFAYSRHPGLQIDLGGIAKGYALALVGDYLDVNGIEHYIVNAGGDLKIAGNRFGRPWRIGIQNPFAPGAVAMLELEGRHSLFTSGDYQRRYWRGGRQTHHIIDPRSGESSRGQSSATVLASDPVQADVAATTLMIDGMRQARELSKSLQIKDFLLINDSKEIVVSRSFADKLEFLVPWPQKIVN